MPIRIPLLALAFGATLSLALAQERQKSTPEERAKAVEVTRTLESDPLGKDAKELRPWLFKWLTDVPDITVSPCPGLLGPVFGSKKNYASEIFFQTLPASAAFIIEHPEQASDKVLVNLAGLEGALRTYQSILKTAPKARWPFLDDLVARREKGTLEAYVREITAAQCKSK